MSEQLDLQEFYKCANEQAVLRNEQVVNSLLVNMPEEESRKVLILIKKLFDNSIPHFDFACNIMSLVFPYPQLVENINFLIGKAGKMTVRPENALLFTFVDGTRYEIDGDDTTILYGPDTPNF